MTLFGKPNFDPTVLDEIVRIGDPSAIPYLTPILLSKSRSDVATAARAVESLLRNARPSDLARLDEAMRHGWYWYPPFFDKWQCLEPRELAKWVGPGEPGVLLIRLSSFHPNGFVREQALCRLGLVEDGTELPYLLIRLGDWVSQVRTAACKLVVERVKPGYACNFVDNIELLYRLRQGVRATSSNSILDSVSDLLTGSEARRAMLAAMSTQTGEVRRWVFRSLAGLVQPELGEFLLAALGNNDPVIRLMALRRIQETFSEAQLRSVLDAMKKEPSGLVRKEVLRVSMNSLPYVSSVLEDALLDRSAAVREEARYLMRQRGAADFGQYYRDQLLTVRPILLPIAIVGLGETGSHRDAQSLIRYLGHATPRIRRAAVKAVAALDADGNINQLMEMVGDQSPGVSAQAFRAMRHKAAGIGAEYFWSIYQTALTPHVRRNALRLIAATSKWDGIGYMLQISGADDSDIAAIAQALIHRWVENFNRSQLVPSAAQLSRVEAALLHSRGIAQADYAFISFALTGFSEA